jgi:hypothetical protein
MPLMAYLALDDVTALGRADHVRLSLAAAPGEDLPMSAGFLADFEAKHCYDRFWEGARDGPMRAFCAAVTPWWRWATPRSRFSPTPNAASSRSSVISCSGSR